MSAFYKYRTFNFKQTIIVLCTRHAIPMVVLVRSNKLYAGMRLEV